MSNHLLPSNIQLFPTTCGYYALFVLKISRNREQWCRWSQTGSLIFNSLNQLRLGKFQFCLRTAHLPCRALHCSRKFLLVANFDFNDISLLLLYTTYLVILFSTFSSSLSFLFSISADSVGLLNNLPALEPASCTCPLTV